MGPLPCGCWQKRGVISRVKIDPILLKFHVQSENPREYIAQFIFILFWYFFFIHYKDKSYKKLVNSIKSINTKYKTIKLKSHYIIVIVV